MELIDTLDRCSLAKFILCQKGEYECLLISGDFDPEKASDAWLTIYDAYNAAIKTKSNNVAFELKKQIHILSNEKTIISTCLFVIAKLIEANIINFDDIHEFDSFVKIVNDFGYKFDKDKPAESLKRIHTQLRNYDTRINMQLKNLEDIEKKGGDWTFSDTIGSVEKYMGFQIDEDKTMMVKFVSYFNQMLRQNK